MNLRSYLESRDGRVLRSGHALVDLAAKAKVSPYYLYMLALGHKRAGWEVAQRLAAASDGAISVQEIRPDVFGQAPTPTETREGAAA